MIDKIVSRKYFPLYLFLFSLVVYTFFTWGVSIYILDEAKNASCAYEMYKNNDFVVPTFNGNMRTDKPPLHYFFMILSYKVFGVNGFAARFFSGVFGALTVLVTFLSTRRFLNEKTAFWSAFIMLASIHLSFQFHMSVPDPYLVFFFTSAAFLFYSALKRKSATDAVLMYVALGLGTLSKGPVAILLPGLIFLLFLIFSKQFTWKNILALKPFWGVFIVLAVALPWYLINGIQTNWEWTEGFLFKHNLKRFSDSMESHGGNFMLTIIFVLAGMFPFTVFFPQAFRSAFKNRKNHFLLFCLIAALTIIGFFTVSETKLINYTVPAYPFLAVIFAHYISNSVSSFRQIRINYFVLLALAFIIPIGGFVGMKYDPSLADINASALWFLVLPAGILFAFKWRKELQKFFLITGATSIITSLVFFSIVFPAIDGQNQVQQSLQFLKDREVVSYWRFSPSYVFYLQKPIKKIAADEFDEFFKQNPDGVIISSTRDIDKIELSPEHEIFFIQKDLFEHPTTVLIEKKKE